VKEAISARWRETVEGLVRPVVDPIIRRTAPGVAVLFTAAGSKVC